MKNVGNVAGNSRASLSRSRVIAKYGRERENFVEHIQVLRLPEPIKLWIKEASRDGLHDYHPIPVSPFLSSPSNTVFLP